MPDRMDGSAGDQERRVGPSPVQIVGSSKKIRDLLARLSVLGQASAPVLITGETGHRQGAVCPRAALPEPTAEPAFRTAELCGGPRTAVRERAVRSRPGRVHGCWGSRGWSAGGSRGRDPCSSTRSTPWSLPSQSKLLRFLQDGEYRRLGSPRTRRADVRILAATNARLDQRVARGAFRRDLVYRLDVLHLAAPSLRDRKEGHSRARVSLRPPVRGAVLLPRAEAVPRGPGGPDRVRLARQRPRARGRDAPRHRAQCGQRAHGEPRRSYAGSRSPKLP